LSSYPKIVSLERVFGALEGLDVPWYLCGGWAVDAFLGRVTREHHDVDIAVFLQHQHIVREHLPDWRLVGHDDNVPGATQVTWDARDLIMPAHIHVYAGDGFEFEFNLNEGPASTWEFHGNPGFELPFEQAVGNSAWGIPIVSPLVNLYYKAIPPMWRNMPRHPPRPHDNEDFEVLLPHLDAGQRAWLSSAIAAMEPEHPWLAKLGT
jgi:hypothetical protein